MSYGIQIYTSRFDFLLDPFCIFFYTCFVLIIVLNLSVYTNKILFIPKWTAVFFFFFLCWKKVKSFCTAKAAHFFSAKNGSIFDIWYLWKFNISLTNDIVSFEQLDQDPILYCAIFLTFSNWIDMKASADLFLVPLDSDCILAARAVPAVLPDIPVNWVNELFSLLVSVGLLRPLKLMKVMVVIRTLRIEGYSRKKSTSSGSKFFSFKSSHQWGGRCLWTITLISTFFPLIQYKYIFRRLHTHQMSNSLTFSLIFQFLSNFSRPTSKFPKENGLYKPQVFDHILFMQTVLWMLCNIIK